MFDQTKPLSEIELQILNDKIEISSSDEDDITYNKDLLGLPFFSSVK
jgi:hypothetical protein